MSLVKGHPNIISIHDVFEDDRVCMPRNACTFIKHFTFYKAWCLAAALRLVAKLAMPTPSIHPTYC